MKEISLKCTAHIGDCLLQLQWCIKVCKNNPDIIVHYWISDSHHKQLQDFIETSISDRLILENLHRLNEPLKDTWINIDGDLTYWCNNLNKTHHTMWDTFYIYFFENLSNHFGIDNPIKTPYDFLFDTTNLLVDNPLTDNYDYLILNSIPKSGQCSIYNKDVFLDMCYRLKHKGYKIITTEPTGIEGVPSTMEHNLSLLDIGNISITSKNIIAVHTGTIHGTLNVFNIDYVENRYIVNTAHINYTYPNCHYINNYAELYKMLKIND